VILGQGCQYLTLHIHILKLDYELVGVLEKHTDKVGNLAMMARLSEILILLTIAVGTILTHINIAIIDLQESDSLPNHYSFSKKQNVQYH
jgi:hypothetical protein